MALKRSEGHILKGISMFTGGNTMILTPQLKVLP